MTEEYIDRKVLPLFGSRVDIYYDDKEKKNILHIERVTPLSGSEMNKLFEILTLDELLREIEFCNIACIQVTKYRVKICDRNGSSWSLYELTNKNKNKLTTLLRESDLFTNEYKGFNICSAGGECDICEEKASIACDGDFFEGADYSEAVNFEDVIFVRKECTEIAKLHKFTSSQLTFHITDQDGRTQFFFGVNYENNLKGLIELADEGIISISSIGKLLANKLDLLEKVKRNYEERMKFLQPYIDFYNNIDESLKLLVELEKDNRQKNDGRERCYESAGC